MLAKLIFLGFNAIFNFLLWPLIIFGNQQSIFIKFLFLTILNYTICTIYFCGRFIYELLIYLNRNDELKSEKIKKNSFFIFINNFYSKFSFSLCITVCQVYWLLFMGGENLMTFPADNFFIIFLGVYLHLLIGVAMYIDMHLLEISFNKQNYNRDFLILCLMQIFYSVLLTILAKLNDDCVIYPFLKLDYTQLLAIYIMIIFALRNSYQLYHHCHKRNKPKNKKVNYTKQSLNNYDNSIDNNLLKEDNLI